MKILRLLFFIFFAGTVAAVAQPQTIDEVVAVVGNEYVLHSEIEVQIQQIKATNPDKADEARCWLMDQLLQKKLLLNRAKTDSLKVTDEQVEGELDRRVQFFASQVGSEAALEEYYNKTIVEIKNDFRTAVREQLLIEQQQNKIIGGVDVTPAEVQDFYNKVPEDSLPYYSSEMEIGQIILFPKVSSGDRQATIKKLRQIRAEVLAGANFSTKAIIFSEDKGSAINGGDLGMARADMYVPEFAAAALALKKDSISDVVETKYGFHIIQMIDRKGDMIHVRHILIKPQVSNQAINNAKLKMDSLRTEIMRDSIKFETAAYKYSEDEETKNRGGLLVDPKTNASRIPVEELDKTIFFAVDKLKIGQVSEPAGFQTADGKVGYRMFYLKTRTLPHKANLKDDYPKIKQIVQEYKKAVELDKWVKKNIPQTYIRLDDEYSTCPNMEHWKKGQNIMLKVQK